MDATTPHGRTSEIEMIAARVVANQARVCSLKMENVEEKLDRLTIKIDKLTVAVNALEKQTVRLDGRWRLFTVVAGIVGALGTIAGIIGVLVAMFR